MSVYHPPCLRCNLSESVKFLQFRIPMRTGSTNKCSRSRVPHFKIRFGHLLSGKLGMCIARFRCCSNAERKPRKQTTEVTTTLRKRDLLHTKTFLSQKTGSFAWTRVDPTIDLSIRPWSASSGTISTFVASSPTKVETF